MAILSKIRKLPIIIIILIIGIPLLTFVMDPSALKDFFSSSKLNSVGEIAGESVTRSQFAKKLELYKKSTNGNVSDIQATKTVWNSIVKEKVYEQQLNSSGLTIGEHDIFNAICEANFIQNDSTLKTNGVFDKSKLKQRLANVKENDAEKWKAWQNYMGNIKRSLQTVAYNDLVSAGLGASLKEGEAQFINNNTKLSGEFVHIPFSSIADSSFKVMESDIKKYIDAHQSEFKVNASRDIKYVKFETLATSEDEANIKDELSKLINEREEFSKAANTTVTVEGFKNTKDYATFFIDNNSDIAYKDEYKFKSTLPENVKANLENAVNGDVFGPYREKDFMKLTKVISSSMLPDSVKASHILIPFVGSRSSKPGFKKTEKEAKVIADSLLVVLKADKSKFEQFAKDFSSDSSAGKGGSLGWFDYNRMVPEFRDYAFNNTTGSIGVVKTVFGFHIIAIDDQKNMQKAFKLATFAREIVASKKTEDKVFEDASIFEQNLMDGKNFDDLAKEKSLEVTPAVGLTALSENIPGIGNQRDIINWSFDSDVEVGNSKRFDTETGYLIATLIDKSAKGLMSIKKATSRVRPIIIEKKKANLIITKMKTATTLEDVANNNSSTVKAFSEVTFKSPTISGVGNEPNVVGAMLNAKENKFCNLIVGNKGVFAFKLNSKTPPSALQSYETERNRLAKKTKSSTYQLFNALKKSSDIKDNLGILYGIQQ